MSYAKVSNRIRENASCRGDKTENVEQSNNRLKYMSIKSEQTRVALKMLHLEDDATDAELIKTELRRRNIPCAVTRICTQKDFVAELQKNGADVILSDSQLPGFDTLSALILSRQICPAVPFIFVSGGISAKARLQAFLHGAADFISKDDLPKLAAALEQIFFFNSNTRPLSHLPEMGMPVMVHCKEFRCLGYLDRMGKWRDFRKSLELSDVIEWSEL
jgi:CheY-like chemotaxis protein